jgi:hypothetical protein
MIGYRGRSSSGAELVKGFLPAPVQDDECGDTIIRAIRHEARSSGLGDGSSNLYLPWVFDKLLIIGYLLDNMFFTR